MLRFFTALLLSSLIPALGWSAVILSWTAPGDNYHTGSSVLRYEIRYATHPISPETWENAILIQNSLIPKPPGSLESFSADVIDGTATYYFGIMAQDSSGNWSEVSNTAHVSYCPSGCIGERGNINADPDENVDINDLLFFVEYFFNETAPSVPPCPQECDVDESGMVDISDLIFIVDYMFVSPPPALIPSCN